MAVQPLTFMIGENCFDVSYKSMIEGVELVGDTMYEVLPRTATTDKTFIKLNDIGTISAVGAEKCPY
jgi:hypothetical protein